MRNLFENLALIAITDMLLSSMVENESRTECRPTFIREDSCNCGRTHKPTSRFFAEHLMPREDKKWGVCECNQREDRNKRFGIRATVDEPRREDYRSRFEFERDHAKFDRLVDAVEACDWKSAPEDAKLHRVNAIRRRIEDGPVMGIDLVGETQWF